MTKADDAGAEMNLDAGRIPVAERFWDKATGGEGCWPWTRNKNKQGYGVIKVDGKNRYAHRIAWSLVRGPVPAKTLVCHHCDNPGCVNPDHLFLGTWHDNKMDAVAKNRQARGHRIGVSKLNNEDVWNIRIAYAKGDTSYPKLAKTYGVTQRAIVCVVKRITWRHV